MSNSNQIVSSAAAFCICLAFYATSVFLWGFIAANNPVVGWLLESFGARYPTFSTLVVWLHDILITVLIAYPFAMLIVRLPKSSAMLGLALSVPAVFASQLMPFLAYSPIAIRDVVLSFGFWLPAIALAISMVAAGLRHPSGAPNGI